MRGIAGLLLAGLLLLSSCGPVRVTVGINDWPPCELWYVARELGVDRRLGIELKLVRYPSWRSNMEAFYRGALDVSHASYFNAVYYSDRGTGGLIGAVSDTVIGADGMVMSRELRSVEELEGRTIGVEVGTDELYLLHLILRDSGLSLDSVTVRSLASAEAPEALRAGEVDAVVTYEPYLSRAAAGARLGPSTREFPAAVRDVLVFSPSLARKRRLAERVRTTWFDTVTWVSASPGNLAAACRLMAEAEGTDPAGFARLFSTFYFFDRRDNERLLAPGGEVERTLADIGALLRKEGTLAEPVVPAELVLQ